jgi:hypothetical protein
LGIKETANAANTHSENLNERYPLGDISINKRIILKLKTVKSKVIPTTGRRGL